MVATRRFAVATALVLCILLPVPASAQTGSTSRVTVSSAGDGVVSGGWWGAISGDGRRVAFASISPKLAPDDNNGVYDVFVHDRLDGSTERVSLSSAGVEANEESDYPHISSDGRFVAFESDGDNLVPGDSNYSRDVFVHELASGLTERVSVDSSGQQGYGSSFEPALSSDGRFVAFYSNADTLVAGDSNGLADVFVRDRQAGTTVRASVDSAGQEALGSSMWPHLSGDGRYVVFQSDAPNLVAGDGNGTWDVFVHDLASGQTTRVSIDSAGNEGDDLSQVGEISADGRYVAFYSWATNLVAGDTNGWPDCFVHDRVSGQTTRVSLSSAGGQGNNESWWPSLSADGRYVAFQSRAKNLVPVGSGLDWAVYVHDRQSGQTTLESVSSSGQSGKRDSRYAALSADGRHVAFCSWGKGLVPDDDNLVVDVFVRDRLGCSSTLASYCVASPTSLPGCTATISGQGVPSLSAAAGFTLSSGPIPGRTLGLVYFGVSGSSTLPFGSQGGQVCVDATRFNAPLKATGGAPGACTGQLDFTLGELISAHPGVVLPGSTVHAAFLFRDPAGPDGFATSNGLWFQVCP